jgi:hypothetical protein|tara:strand:- start:2278 stop:2505 length:228 start_codon:yes stop_codon:yes gene_type:complete
MKAEMSFQLDTTEIDKKFWDKTNEELSIAKQRYVDVRIEQLAEERDKNTDTYDIAWYNRLIEELTWAQQMSERKR